MRTSILALSLALMLCFGSLAGVAAAADHSSAVVQSAKKKKKKKKCKVGYKKTSKGCKKGPYKKGQTCSMSKQTEYQKYGYVCLDLSTPGFPLTYLDVYKK